MGDPDPAPYGACWLHFLLKNISQNWAEISQAWLLLGQAEPLRIYSRRSIAVQAMLWQVLELSLLSREYGGLEVHADLVMSCKLY